MTKNYYQILETEPKSSELEIKKAYFSMIRRYPPERFPDEFIEIRGAYETLSNEKTRMEYDSIISLPPLISEAFTYARDALAEDDVETALRLLEEVASRVPSASFVQSLLSEAYLKNGNPGRAIKILKKLVRAHPRNAAFIGHLAHAYLSRGWHKKAIKAFWRAISLDEDNLSLWLGMSGAFADAGDVKEARDVLLEALRRGKNKDWDNIGLYFNLIHTDIILDNIEDMEEHLEELTRLAISQEDTRESVGWALAKLTQMMVHRGFTEVARSVVRQAANLLPDDSNIQSLKNDLDRSEELKEQLEELEEDDNVIQGIKALFWAELMPKAIFANSMQHEAMQFFAEFVIMEKHYLYINSIIYLKEHYPALYHTKAEFFETVKSRKARKKRLQQCRNKLPMYKNILERLPSFECPDEDSYFVEDSDFDEDSDFSDWEDREETPQQPYVRETPKIGRNEPCPCGSGKKYKKCCG